MRQDLSNGLRARTSARIVPAFSQIRPIPARGGVLTCSRDVRTMFRVITLNVNGLRSAVSKGLLRWLARRQPDVVCLQEIKAQAADLSDALLNPAGLHAQFHFAQARGYSGTALLSRKRPRKVQIGFGVDEFDREGRYVE